jgi:hypothetical protein
LLILEFLTFSSSSLLLFFMDKKVETTSEGSERKEWGSRQVAQEHAMQEKERRRNQKSRETS